jgi:hypothetical protein
MAQTTQGSAAGETTRRAGAFDIRTFIAMLIGIYGVILVVTGLFATTGDQLKKSDGWNVNLWAGIGMLVFAVAFAVWARLRPVIVPEHVETAEAADEGEPDRVARP